MAIQVECDECGSAYRVKEEMSGKKFRCKACSAVIEIPSSDSDDDWEMDDVEVDDDHEDADDSDADRLPRRKSRKGSSKQRSINKPVTIIVALICLGLMIGISLLNVLGGFVLDPALLPGAQPGGANANAVRVGFIIGCGIKLLTQIFIFLGLLNRRRDCRIGGAILGGINALLVIGRLVAGPAQAGELIELAAGVFLRVVFIGCLLTPSSADYCRE